MGGEAGGPGVQSHPWLYDLLCPGSKTKHKSCSMRDVLVCGILFYFFFKSFWGFVGVWWETAKLAWKASTDT